VKKGETFYRICKTYGVDPNEVARVNHLTDPTALSVGQKLWVPGADHAMEVQTPTPAPGYAGSPGGPAKPPSSMKGTLLFPVPGGNLGSRFGPRDDRMHEGLDILAPVGTPILAAEDGKVVYADDTIRGYGNMVIVKHAGNISTVYAHNSKDLVKSGDLVRRGQKIAEVGQTGRASAPHCHFEVRVGEKPTDPEFFLP
jgi:murein DD-endopeptidase MepM/ murein hydrolase activator NlpD